MTPRQSNYLPGFQGFGPNLPKIEISGAFQIDQSSDSLGSPKGFKAARRILSRHTSVDHTLCKVMELEGRTCSCQARAVTHWPTCRTIGKCSCTDPRRRSCLGRRAGTTQSRLGQRHPKMDSTSGCQTVSSTRQIRRSRRRRG